MLWSRSKSKGVQSHECIRRFEILQGADQAFVEELLGELSLETFSEGSEILRRGEDAEKLFFLNVGEVSVLVGEDTRQVAILSTGSIFGEMAFFTNTVRCATVRARSFCDCRSLPFAALGAVLSRFPAERARFERLAKLRTDANAARFPSAIWKPPTAVELNAVRRRSSLAIVRAKELSQWARKSLSVQEPDCPQEEGDQNLPDSPRTTFTEPLEALRCRTAPALLLPGITPRGQQKVVSFGDFSQGAKSSATPRSQARCSKEKQSTQRPTVPQSPSRRSKPSGFGTGAGTPRGSTPLSALRKAHLTAPAMPAGIGTVFCLRTAKSTGVGLVS